jgi:hypothetical protein
MKDVHLTKIASVEEIEPTSQWVYDIEVSDASHLFVADDIVVHNSLFFCWDKVFKSCDFKGDKLQFVLDLYQYRLKQLFVDKLEEFAASYGVDNIQDFELEDISESIIFLTKKRYVKHLKWSEGITYDSLSKFTYKGVQLIRSSTPKFARERIPALINIIFADPYHVNYVDLLKEMKAIKKEFMVAPMEDLCFQVGTNTYNDWVVDDKDSLRFKKGAPQGVKAAALYNYMIQQNPELMNKYMLIAKGDKCKAYYTTDPKYPVFAFLRNRYPSEIAPPMDYELQFRKQMLDIINAFIEASGFLPFNDRLSMVSSLF